MASNQSNPPVQQDEVLRYKNLNFTQNKETKSVNKQSLAFMSLIKKDDQNTTRKHHTSYAHYSQIFTSFNKRMTQLYSQEEQDNLNATEKENQNNDKNLIQTHSTYQNRNHQLIVTPFRIEGMEMKTPLPRHQKFSSQFKQSRQVNQESINLTQQNLKNNAYRALSQKDPYLLQIGNQLDEEHKRQKEEILQETFMKRYQQLVQKQNIFQEYQQNVSIETAKLQNKIIEISSQKEAVWNQNAQLVENMKQLKEQHENMVKNRQIKHEQENKQFLAQIQVLTQAIRQKDSQIQTLHNKTIKQLQSRLDEQVEQNVQLKKSLNQYISQINTKNELLSKNDNKHSELIETLQLSLSSSESQKNRLSEDFQKVCQELQSLRESFKTLNKHLEKQQSECDKKAKELSQLELSFRKYKESSQQQIHEHKIKYLQEIKEKNSIIDQYEQSKEETSSMGCKLTQLKKKLLLIETQLEDKDKSIKTQRQLYLQNCADYQARLSRLRQEKEKSQKELKLIHEQLSTINKKNQIQTISYHQKVVSLSAQLTQSKLLLQQLRKQSAQLTYFKTHKQQQFQVSKQSFLQITDELKSQLQKAKEIILSKNQQINNSRQMIHSLKKQLTQLKSSHCQTENQLNDIILKQEEDQNYWKLILKQKEQKFNSFEREKENEVIQLKSLIDELNLRISSLEKQLNAKEYDASGLKLQIQTLTKQNKEQSLELIVLQNKMKTNQKNNSQKLSSCELLNQQQISQIIHQHQLNVQTLNQAHKIELQQRNREIQYLNQQLALKQRQLLTSNNLITQMRHQNLSIKSQNQQLRSKIQVLQQQLSLSHQQQQVWKEKYHLQNQQILSKISQNHILTQKQDSHLLTNSSKSNLAYEHESQMCPNASQSSTNPNISSKLSTPSKQQAEMVEKKYLQVIEQMKLQFMELTIYFKQKSAHQQQLRLLLENQNQQLQSQLCQNISLQNQSLNQSRNS